jgi:ABC-type nitrate/sulfonate/bicarbonate transport system ATPase subunit
VLSERPGTVVARIEVDLPRPRSVATLGLPRFQQLTQELRSYFIETPDGGAAR